MPSKPWDFHTSGHHCQTRRLPICQSRSVLLNKFWHKRQCGVKTWQVRTLHSRIRQLDAASQREKSRIQKAVPSSLSEPTLAAVAREQLFVAAAVTATAWPTSSDVVRFTAEAATAWDDVSELRFLHNYPRQLAWSSAAAAVRSCYKPAAAEPL